jgi:hypothetical protein
MHAHAIQFDPNLQLRELYAMERAAANKRADTVRRKLKFASSSATEWTFGDCISAVDSHQDSSGQAEQQQGEEKSLVSEDQKLSSSNMGSKIFSDWA